jgi:hypothetical protein
MKVARNYTIEELNNMSVLVAKKHAIRQGISRTSHPPQSEFTHPICITASCTNPKTVNDWHWTSGLPQYKDICIKCHTKKVAGKHGFTRISQVVAKNAGFDSDTEHRNTTHHDRKHRKDYCENIDGHLGFTCPVLTKESWVGFEIGCLDLDHVDGNHNNNTPDNVKTYCKLCHNKKSSRQS